MSIARILTRLPLELCVESGRILSQSRQIVSCTELTHEARRMPSRPGRQLFAFKQDDIRPTAKGQMVGQAAPYDSTAMMTT